MEKNFRFSAMLAACLVSYLFLASCAGDHNFTGGPGLVLNGPINITGYDTSDGTLTLRDTNGNNAYNAIVKRNTTVDWNLTASTQKKIVIKAIKSDPRFPSNDPNFFSVPPQPAGSSDHWQAKIEDLDIKKGAIEKYYIEWQVKGKPETYLFDPLLQLNPQ